MDYSSVNYLWFFVMYAFFGWWLEVTFQKVTVGKFINRCFLNGLVCPVYGFGMVTLLDEMAGTKIDPIKKSRFDES